MAIDSIARGMAANAESGGGGGGGSVDIEQGIGISITGDEVKKISNAGVTSISEGTENGTIAVTVAGKTTTQIPVYGLGSAAYKDVATTLDDSNKVIISSAVKTELDKKINIADIDSAISETSENPVQNKIIKIALDGKASTAIVSKEENGLVPKVTNENAYLQGNGEWTVPIDTTYTIEESTENGNIKVITHTPGTNDTTINVPVHGLGSAAFKTDTDFLNSTTKYAGASTKGGSATSAVKLDSSAGSTTQPVYFKSGKPVVIDYTIETNVPKDAVFTDTTYEFTEGTTNGAFMVNGNAVSVHGLNNAAYKDVDTAVTDSTNLLTSSAVKTELENYAKKSDITNVYKYKGTLPAFENLPTTGMEIGDVYDIRESGMNYAWDGEKWDAMGSTFTFETMSIEDIDALFNK